MKLYSSQEAKPTDQMPPAAPKGQNSLMPKEFGKWESCTIRINLFTFNGSDGTTIEFEGMWNAGRMQIDVQVKEITWPRAMVKGQDWIIGALPGTSKALVGVCAWEGMEEKLDF